MTVRPTSPPGVHAAEGFLDRPASEPVKAGMRARAYARAKVQDRSERSAAVSWYV